VSNVAAASAAGIRWLLLPDAAPTKKADSRPTTHRQLRDVHQAVGLGADVDEGTVGLHRALCVQYKRRKGCSGYCCGAGWI